MIPLRQVGNNYRGEHLVSGQKTGVVPPGVFASKKLTNANSAGYLGTFIHIW